MIEIGQIIDAPLGQFLAEPVEFIDADGMTVAGDTSVRCLNGSTDMVCYDPYSPCDQD